MDGGQIYRMLEQMSTCIKLAFINQAKRNEKRITVDVVSLVIESCL